MFKKIMKTLFLFGICLVIASCESIGQEQQYTPAEAENKAEISPTDTPETVAGLCEGLRSNNSNNAAVTLTFLNMTGRNLNIVHTDTEGNDHDYGQIAPQGQIEQGTYASHAWCFRDVETGVDLLGILAEETRVVEISIPEDSALREMIEEDDLLSLAESVAPVGERSYFDRPDDHEGLYQVHVFYVLPADGEDRQLDLNGSIKKSIADVNQWFFEKTGGSMLRFDTYQGELDITFIPLKESNAEFYDEVVGVYGDGGGMLDYLSDYKLVQYMKPGKIYLTFIEVERHTYTCANANNRMSGIFTIAYMEDFGYNCDMKIGEGNSGTDMTIAHELVHSLGFTFSCLTNPANAEDNGHTGDFTTDLMFAGNGEWDVDNMQLDPGNDDYFNHNIPDCPDLANSAFLDPLPVNAEPPPRWEHSLWVLP